LEYLLSDSYPDNFSHAGYFLLLPAKVASKALCACGQAKGMAVNSTAKEESMLEREYAWYKAHYPELVTEYLGQFIVIVEDEVKGAFGSVQDAYNDSITKFPLGTFLIQEIVDDPGKLLKRFYSRVHV
jgi:hypothetical protein